MVDSLEAKPAGWYPSSRSPGLERYWNGDYWTEDYRPDPDFAIQENPQAALYETARVETSEAKLLTVAQSSRPHQSAPPAATGLHEPSIVESSTQKAMEASDSSIIALVTAIFWPLFGVILGYLALHRAKLNGEPQSLALLAVIIGWIFSITSLFVSIPLIINMLAILNGRV